MKRFLKILTTILICLGLVFFSSAIFLLCTSQTAYATSQSSTTNSSDGTSHSRAYDDGRAGVNKNYGGTSQAPNTTNESTSTGSGGFSLNFNGDSGSLNSTIRILLILTIIALCPAILVMMTSFTRVIIVLHFVRLALGTQTTPPNQVIIGLALFLTLFIMWPTFSSVYKKAIVPFDQGKITQEQAYNRGKEPIREFMYGQTQSKDLNLFCDIAGITYNDYDDVPMHVLIPSFVLSELRTAFIMGFLIYIPFIVIDMVVASVLMSMGMMMLPPTTISLPFKILLFIMADGWNLVIGSLVKTFQ
ncbi:MAG: flagellar biosynthetic protein FliP [Lachnospiraceae bacterium]|uniref:Flagellar biosynthetic protein FliP n=1 Tax=Candidatus Weimeria bifida TaxID=2599074 RepID=A0A6N7J085_9FIRM|nr:flagellar type III secretion system pore protein FliP [Candidatus Weimeria bifida]RRF96323.1 MAG: flagellar biosynthetic protein FliP [Lachnospiraceae bacterium]